MIHLMARDLLSRIRMHLFKFLKDSTWKKWDRVSLFLCQVSALRLFYIIIIAIYNLKIIKTYIYYHALENFENYKNIYIK